MAAGLTGPGTPAPNNLPERLLGHGARPVDPGLFAENPHVAVPGEGPIGLDELGRLLRGLQELVRNTIGLNVRQPSSNVPPFRADQWLFDQTVTLASGISATVAVNFRPGQLEVPEGVRGVLASLEFWFVANNEGALVVPTFVSLDLRKNTLTVPGYQAMQPGAITLETITDAAGSDAVGSEFPGERAFVPVKLETGDELSLVFGPNLGATDITTRVLLAGWWYPIEVEADGVLGTVADRGSGAGYGSA